MINKRVGGSIHHTIFSPEHAAEEMGIAIRTFNLFKKNHPEIKPMIIGKGHFYTDEQVAEMTRLYRGDPTKKWREKMAKLTPKQRLRAKRRRWWKKQAEAQKKATS